jgi:hypothetical protein
MNILVTGLWFPLCTPVVFRDAFRRMNHDVTTVGPCFGEVIPWGGMMILPGKAQTPDVEGLWDDHLTVTDVEEKAGKRFDLVLQCDANYFIERGDYKGSFICYACDNHVLEYGHIDEYDLFFASHSWANHHEHPKFRWLPGGREPHAVDLGLERRYDVCIIGTMYQQRHEIIKLLLVKNVTMLLGWGRLYEEWNYLHNLALATVVEPCKNDLSGRVFNHFAQGTLVLMRRGIPDAEKIGMKEWVHYLPYGDPREIPDLLKIARDKQARRVFTERAKVWVQEHTWERMLQILIDEAGRVGK